MAPTNAEGHEPIKLSDSDEFRLEHQAQDIRGLGPLRQRRCPDR
jgi:hypothetical protein